MDVQTAQNRTNQDSGIMQTKAKEVEVERLIQIVARVMSSRFLFKSNPSPSAAL
jgi:hypothetical protein